MSYKQNYLNGFGSKYIIRKLLSKTKEIYCPEKLKDTKQIAIRGNKIPYGKKQLSDSGSTTFNTVSHIHEFLDNSKFLRSHL